MFSRKKETRTRPRPAGGLSQYGLFDLPDVNTLDPNEMGVDGEDDDDDSALEAELLAITSGSVPARPKRARPAPPGPQVNNLDAMVAESLKDIPSDEEVSGDDDDPELLNELGALAEDESTLEAEKPPSTPVTPSRTNLGNSFVNTLEERLKMYQEAEKNAKAAGESSRARRFGRGIKTLNDLIKQAKAGRVVNEEDIPPPVAITLTKKPDVAPAADETSPEMVPTRPAPQPPIPERPQFGVPLPGMASAEQKQSPQKEDPPPIPPRPSPTSDQNATIAALVARRDEYKIAALQAKKAGDKETAINYVRIVKKFEIVISAVEGGQTVDLSEMPPPPPPVGSVKTTPTNTETAVEESEKQTDADNPQPPEGATGGEAQQETDLFNAPPAPTTVMEALLQRLDKYKSVEKAAKDEGNASKARRIGRIVKQYENAVKLHKAGKPVPFDELPTPPGFAPIPQDGGGPPSSPAIPSSPPLEPSAEEETPKPSPRPRPSPAPSPASQPTSPQNVQPAPEKANVRKSPQSRQEKQMALLLARQKEFKEAALQAKQKGELNQAKEYLRLAKGFDPLIEATNCGLPVDMDSVPVPPNTKIVLESDFDIVNVDDCIPGSDSEIFDKLEEDLLKQVKMCLTTKDHFKAIGDIASANRFEQLALHSKKDLDAVRYAHKRNESIPKFHYENKTFSIVQCCTDLGDNDVELTIVQGINYNVPNPKDVDTYVRFEFPYPNDYPQKDKTAVIKDSNNPQYNQTFPLTMQRNVRACQRIFKRQSLKCEVWSRGSVIRNLCCFCCPETCGKTVSCSGFFRGDSLIGTANVKLQPLETKCILHDAFDLLEGRKAVGGKLEVKIRIRNPIVTKQVEQVKEKWLVIDAL